MEDGRVDRDHLALPRGGVALRDARVVNQEQRAERARVRRALRRGFVLGDVVLVDGLVEPVVAAPAARDGDAVGVDRVRCDALPDLLILGLGGGIRRGVVGVCRTGGDAERRERAERNERESGLECVALGGSTGVRGATPMALRPEGLRSWRFRREQRTEDWEWGWECPLAARLRIAGPHSNSHPLFLCPLLSLLSLAAWSSGRVADWRSSRPPRYRRRSAGPRNSPRRHA